MPLIELSEKEIRAENRKSSKGSQLLRYSNLESSEFVVYQTEEIR